MRNRIGSASALLYLLLHSFGHHGEVQAASTAPYSLRVDYDAEHRLLRKETLRFISEYDRDAETGRLVGLRRFRISDSFVLQEIGFEYDLNGCLIRIADAANEEFRFARGEECRLAGIAGKGVDLAISYPREHDIRVDMSGVGSIIFHFDADAEEAEKETSGDSDRLYELIDPILEKLNGITSVTGLNWWTGKEKNVRAAVDE